MEDKDTAGGKNKDEEILRLRKLAAIFKNECKKLKEENDTLKKGTYVNKKDVSDDKKSCSTGDEEDMVLKLNNEFKKRIIIEKSYRKLKDFTLLLEEKHQNLKKENNEKCKNLEDKMNDYIADLNLCKNENKKLEEKIKEKDEDIDKLNKKIDEYKLYFSSEKNVMNCLENSIDETVQYKLEIKKLKENLEILKKNDDITSKERQQYKSIIMLCSQYKEKCKVIPVLEAKIDVLESKVKELDVYRHRDMEKAENIKELKNTILNHQIENNKLMQQLSEWTNFSKLYINSNTVNIDSLKETMNQIHNKYNQVNYSKIDLETKFRRLSTDLQLVKQKLEDKNLEVKIFKNKNSQLEKKYNFLKKDYLYEVNKNKTASLEQGNNLNRDLKGKNCMNAKVGRTYAQTEHTSDEITGMGGEAGSEAGSKAGRKAGSEAGIEAEREMLRKNENLARRINEYKVKYDSVKKDNDEKEKLIEEMKEKLEKYKNDYERFYLKQKSVDLYSQEILMCNNEIKYLKDESEDYKNKIFKLENDLILIKNMWNADNEKNEILIKNLKDTIKKIQFNIKINNSTNKLKKDMSNIMNNKNDIHILYKDLENIKSIDELELANVRNENTYLKSKIEIIKMFYSNQIKTYREAFLYILGWDIQIEENNEDIFFILTSLFSTHDGKFIFIKNKCSNEKRPYQAFSETYGHPKRVKLGQGGKEAEQQSVKGKAEEQPVKDKAEEHHVSDKAEEHHVSDKAEEHHVSDKAEEHHVSDKAEEHHVSDKSEEHPVSSEADFYEGLIGECNEINTNAVIEKSQLENTNMNMSTIMKGCKYNLLLHGYYGIKWKENTEWKNYLNKMNTYPILLALSCMEEYNNIKSQYRNCLGKNCKGMLFKI
ncbi:conserved Plasmodium protein, unknown function [Plasmodium ovale wallikeri]|uniref:Uncharacterized protein n=1 Tax=Plasmodium ovale wallikeri TaxID=864142 RepID=A0A1A8YJQ0_PLAOA|nr:conserved Plasmodium protein, unknown function [Plasmodium ovale wallikeri]